MADPIVIAALIGAGPAGLAAYAAFKTKAQTSTNGSGIPIGKLVEANHLLLKQHLEDPDAHEHQSVCDTCLS